MPTLFIPHGGGPCFFMDWNPADTWTRMAEFLSGLAATLPRRPKAILLVSAHWLTPTFEVGGNAKPDLIYDYYGFPEHTYQLRYGAPGSPDLAARVRGLLSADGVANGIDLTRGFDHGVFIPLKLVFPDAEIPVVQFSIRADLDAAAHIEAGRALEALRDEDVLILGSGMSFHNMRGYGNPAFGPVSDAFDAWLTSVVSADPAARNAALADWANAPGARQSHPVGGEEHLLPLMIAAGAAGDGKGQRIFGDRVMETTISAFRFD
jgi:aromatic ring-opening dioxygenase catalytic subunit (LigB family)